MMNKRRRSKFDLVEGSAKEREKLMSAELMLLRDLAIENLTTLGYFDKEAKELQTFEVTVESGHNPWEVPKLPSDITFQVAVAHKPEPLVIITRNEVIKGKRFEPKKYFEPFTAIGKDRIVFGVRGHAVIPSTFKLVLEKLTHLATPPIQRPVK